MPVAEQIGIEHAYRVLGVPREAPAFRIKQAYRKLVKRWHPDLYAVGTTAHAEATEMSRVINEAYATVSHAPLRYLKNYPGDTNFDRETRTTTSSQLRSADVILQRLDKIEFWLRFVCGALLGGFITFDILINASSDPFHYASWYLLSLFAAVMGVFGYAAVRSGDKFWHSFFRFWS